MKSCSTIKPEKFVIEKSQEKTILHFHENILEIEADGDVRYEYEHTFIETNFYPNLENDVSENYEVWLQFAKENQPKRQLSEAEILKQEVEVLKGNLETLANDLNQVHVLLYQLVNRDANLDLD